MAQLEQNVKAAQDGPLPEDVVRKIDEIEAMAPFRPFEEPFGCSFFDNEFHRHARYPGAA